MEPEVDLAWEYNAPQFVDFTSTHSLDEDESVETYFDYDHENGEPIIPEVFEDAADNTPIQTPARATRSKSTPMSTRKSAIKNNAVSAKKSTPKSARRSVAAGRQSSPKKSMTPRRTRSQSAKNTPEPQLDAHENDKENSESTEKPKYHIPANIVASLSAWRKGNKPKRQENQQKKSPASKKAVLKNHNADHPEPPPSDLGKSPLLKRSRKKSPEPQLNIVQPKLLRTRTRTVSVERKVKLTGRSRGESLDRSKDSTCSTKSVRSMPSGSSKPEKKVSALKRSSSMRDMRKKPVMAAPAKKPAPFVKPKLTMPMTPACLKRKPIGPKAPHKTAEEIEMEKIEEKRKELTQRRKLAEESRKLAMSSQSYVPVRSVSSLTKADEFQFATDSRVKSHSMETRNDADGKDFVGSLRSSSKVDAAHKADKPRVTLPQPFNLHERKRKRTVDEPHSMEPNCKFTSMAEQVSKFAAKTPDRFHTHSKKGDHNPKPAPQREPLKLTHPKTPNFQTKTRHRPNTAVSQAELEEQEINDMKNYEFHAKPFSKKIQEGICGLKPQPERHVTMPESPAFALKDRVRPPKIMSPEFKHEPLRRVRSQALVAGVPFVPTIKHKTTDIQPFSFEENTKQMAIKKEQKMQQVLDEEKKAREFKANPLPSSSPSHLPQVSAKMPTKPEPFRLPGESIGAAKAAEWSRKMEEELHQQKAAAMFKARPCVTTIKEPFIPKKSDKALTDLCDFELSTERRAEERNEWETRKAEKEQEIARLKAAAEAYEHEQEEKEIARLRQQTVHKATSIKKYKPVLVKPSEKSCTIPATPKFSDRLRKRRNTETEDDSFN